MSGRRLMRVLLGLGLAVGIAVAIIYRDRFDAAALEAWINEAGVLAPVVFVLIYALVTVLFLPGAVMTLAGGALFGPSLGTLYKLTEQGFHDVHVVRGGMTKWLEASLPVRNRAQL